MSSPRAHFLVPAFVKRAGTYYRRFPVLIFTNMMMLIGGILLLNYGGDPIEGFFAAIGLACLKVVPPILNMAGIHPDLSEYGAASFVGLFTILLLLTLRVVMPFYALYFSHVWSYQNENVAPPSRGVLFFWGLMAAIGGYLAFAVRNLPLSSTKDYIILSFLGLRLMLFYMAVSFALMSTAIVWTFYRERRQLQPPKTTNTTKPAQAAAAVAPVASPVPPRPKAFTLPEVDSFYRALAAEMIQFTGFNNRAPQAEELITTLLTLQRAARMTNSDHGLDETVLRERCEKALVLFKDSELAALKNVKAAQRLFNTPRPGAMMELAAELQQKIGLYKL